MVEEEGGMESRIQEAMRCRVPDFRVRADSLTFEAVRRELEKDLELDKYALDVHKRYVKQLLEKFLNGADDESISKDTGESTAEGVNEEQAEPSGENPVKEDSRELNSQEEEMEDSPVMGLLTGNKSTKSGNVETQGNEKNEIPSESTVKKAIWKRAAYLRTNSEKITVAGVRRLLEEDLQLDKYTLDPLKKLISKQLDEVVNSPSPKSATPDKKKSSLNSQSKTSKKTSQIESSDSSDSEKDDDGHEEAPKKKGGTKGKIQKSEGLKKRKRPVKEAQVSRKKQSKAAASAENSEGEDSGETSEDGQSRSSAGKTVKKKEVLPTAYGKQVEHLKSIIKSCGMSVAPTVYKKAKQIPDNKRESFLIKELEQILSKEGLSSDPSEKEIKEVKRRKERAKELEGIDMSNIVLSSRRRSTASFVPPPKPKPPVKSDGDDTEDSDNEDGAAAADDDDNDDSDSQSEEVLEDDDSD